MIARRWTAGVTMAAALALLPTGSFALDPGASRVEFFVRDNRGGFTGIARDVQATAVVREQGGVFAAEVDARIDARALTTGIGLRDSQMRREFLLTDRYPVITFHGSAVPVGSVTGLSFRALVAGRLTIREVTRDVEFPVRVIALRDSYLVDGTVTIRMTEFGIPIPRFFIFAAEDPVEVTLKVKFQPSGQP